jgi:uncharacterized protein DUF4145
MAQKLSGSWQNTVAMGETQYTCPYCGSLTASDLGWYFIQGGAYSQYVIRICSYCKQPTYFGPDGQVPGSPFGESVEGVPADVAKMYTEARNCTSANAYTAAVLVCRKILMHVAVAEGAPPNKSFKEYVDYLEANNYLPPKGKAWVDHVRDKGNEANHEIVEMKQEDAQLLITFLGMLMKFIYEFPTKVPAKIPVKVVGKSTP